MTWLYISAALIAVCGVLFVTVRVQSGRVKKYREENEELLGEMRRTAERLAGLAALAARNKKVKEAADELRRELEETADGALADRARPLCSAGCATGKAAEAVTEIRAAADSLMPEVPSPPVTEAVVFEERDGGLWLSARDYRALERNIIAMREYAEELVLIIKFYGGGE